MRTAQPSQSQHGPIVDLLAGYDDEYRRHWLATRTPGQLEDLKYGWRDVRARPEQLAPGGDWSVWVYMAGRGAGKTRSAAEWVHERAISGKFELGALVAPTPHDARVFCVEGPSGLLNVGRPRDRPTYIAGRKEIVWPSGFKMMVYSAEDPDQIRGPNVDTAWATELAAWPVAKGKRLEEMGSKAQQAWDNLMFTLRIGDDPRCVVDTTPRPMEPLKSILKDPNTVLTRGSTYDNRANLATKFFNSLSKYEGTRIGRRELYGELLEDVEGALWNLRLIDETRCEGPPARLDRVVVGVDPPGETAECGIVVMGHVAANKRSYVLDDRSTAGTPREWASAVIRAFDDHEADLVVAETNFGGAMVKDNLRRIRSNLPVKEVRASRGKAIRAEPISTLYETGEIRHAGKFPQLEDQMTQWVPGMTSPDRLDAMVWAATEIAKPLFDLIAPVSISRVSPNRIQ